MKTEVIFFHGDYRLGNRSPGRVSFQQRSLKAKVTPCSLSRSATHCSPDNISITIFFVIIEIVFQGVKPLETRCRTHPNVANRTCILGINTLHMHFAVGSGRHCYWKVAQWEVESSFIWQGSTRPPISFSISSWRKGSIRRAFWVARGCDVGSFFLKGKYSWLPLPKK